MMNNRGVSPLVATILLITFSVALGAVVMSYGEAFVEEKAEFVSGVPEVGTAVCDAIELEIITLGQTPQVCSGDGFIEVALDNGPDREVDGLQARILGEDDVVIVNDILDKPLLRATSLKTVIKHADVGELLQVKLTPILRDDDGQVFCSDRAVAVDLPPDCK